MPPTANRDAHRHTTATAPQTPAMLWLDDLRPAPVGWTWCRSVEEATALMSSTPVSHASLDHDLGDYAAHGGDGTRFTDHCAAKDTWPTHGVRVHSSNPIGVATMLATIDRYGPYQARAHNARGTTPDGGWPPALMG